MGMPKSVEVWNVWKECGIFPQKVVEHYCGMGEWGNGGMGKWRNGAWRWFRTGMCETRTML